MHRRLPIPVKWFLQRRRVCRAILVRAEYGPVLRGRCNWSLRPADRHLGAGSGAAFSVVTGSTPTINHAGQIAFRGGLADGGTVNSTNDSGIWSNIGGTLTNVVRAGSQAAGLPAGTTYASFQPAANFVDPVLNDTGEMAFVAGLAGDGNVQTGVFVGKPGAFTPVILKNQSVPGLPAADKLTSFEDLNLNDAGQMIFLGIFSGPGVTAPFDDALLSYDPSTGVRVVAMSGVEIPGIGVAPLTLGLVGDNDGYQAGSLSNTGQFVFSGNFSDVGFRIMSGSVPEPTTLTLTIVAAIPILMRRRSRHIQLM